MSNLKANVSKSLALRNRVKFWLEDNKSFKNAYQALSHDDAEVIDVTFDTSHQLAVREYTVVECYTLSDYLRLIEYNPQKPLLEMNLTLI